MKKKAEDYTKWDRAGFARYVMLIFLAVVGCTDQPKEVPVRPNGCTHQGGWCPCNPCGPCECTKCECH